tara:strand:+ start:172 stop:330 length:159 start_codon:yes stop_codon:yes gene_type:complete
MFPKEIANPKINLPSIIYISILSIDLENVRAYEDKRIVRIEVFVIIRVSKVP